jgi:3-mercaptopropionate dioxygenase
MCLLESGSRCRNSNALKRRNEKPDLTATGGDRGAKVASPRVPGENHPQMTLEFVLDTPAVRAFVDDVREAIALAGSPEEACAAIEPRFAQLLADPSWLPAGYQQPVPNSGMGGGIGQWLLCRDDDGSLSLFALVIPPDAETPVHDHLAWGLVGLYRGTQDEEIYSHDQRELRVVERRSLEQGDFYSLIPPADDIHRVRTTSPEASVSIHLLTNDTGCVWRHAFDVSSGEARPFRSGYVSLACDDETD